VRLALQTSKEANELARQTKAGAESKDPRTDETGEEKKSLKGLKTFRQRASFGVCLFCTIAQIFLGVVQLLTILIFFFRARSREVSRSSSRSRID
jgi:hypothetical protein